MRQLFTLLLLCVLAVGMVGMVGCGVGGGPAPEVDTAADPSALPSSDDAKKELSEAGKAPPSP